MKALSLHQPWASLLAHGLKRVETRGWNMTHRGPLLIHAAKRWDPHLAEICTDPLFFRPALQAIGVNLTADEGACKRGWGLPFGTIVGRVNVVDCVPTARVLVDDSVAKAVITLDRDSNRWMGIDHRERAYGDYTPGRYAFLCDDFEAFAEPIPFRGAQMVFEIPDNLLPKDVCDPCCSSR